MNKIKYYRKKEYLYLSYYNLFDKIRSTNHAYFDFIYEGLCYFGKKLFKNIQKERLKISENIEETMKMRRELKDFMKTVKKEFDILYIDSSLNLVLTKKKERENKEGINDDRKKD